MEIILVEDDLVTTMLHERVVQKVLPEAIVHKFSDGKTVYDFIVSNNHPEKRYLVLLDLTMRIMDGWEFLDSMLEQDTHCKMAVVVITTSVDPDDFFKSRDYPQVFGFYGKPFTINQFQDVLQHEAVLNLKQ
jgi:response regulator of citrate/malate metabolism